MNNYPHNHCYNPQFRYIKAEHTDIRQTFERIKQEQARTIEMPELRSNEDIRRQLGWFLK